MSFKDDIETGSFAEACYDSNNIADMIEGLLEKKGDETDCKAWNLTPTQYRFELANALWHMIQDKTDGCCHRSRR